MYEVKVTREFSSAHFLRDYAGKCANLHGHNWKVEVGFRHPELAANGILVDFTAVWRALDELIELLDHRVINDLPPFDRESPTSENLARWFFQEVGRRLPAPAPQPHHATVWETPDASATYWPDEGD